MRSSLRKIACVVIPLTLISSVCAQTPVVTQPPLPNSTWGPAKTPTVPVPVHPAFSPSTDTPLPNSTWGPATGPGCQPDCSNRKHCGDDGCGGLCGVCVAGDECVDGQCIPNVCKASCLNRSCGSDGCGGLCGVCGPGMACGADSRCAKSYPTGCKDGYYEQDSQCKKYNAIIEKLGGMGISAAVSVVLCKEACAVNPFQCRMCVAGVISTIYTFKGEAYLTVQQITEISELNNRCQDELAKCNGSGDLNDPSLCDPTVRRGKVNMPYCSVCCTRLHPYHRLPPDVDFDRPGSRVPWEHGEGPIVQGPNDAKRAACMADCVDRAREQEFYARVEGEMQ